jgi:hypothetical protein
MSGDTGNKPERSLGESNRASGQGPSAERSQGFVLSAMDRKRRPDDFAKEQ